MVCHLAAEAIHQGGEGRSTAAETPEAGGGRSHGYYSSGGRTSRQQQQKCSQPGAEGDLEMQLIIEVKQWLKLMES